MKKEKINELRKNIKNVWYYVKPDKYNLLGYLFVAVLECVLGILFPIYSAKQILNITDGLFQQLFFTTCVVLVLNLGFSFTSYFKAFFYQRIHRHTMKRLQVDVAREILKLEMQELDKSSSGTFIERLNHDTRDMSGVFMEISYWITQIISKVGILVAIFILNKYIFVFCLIIALVLSLINKYYLDLQYKIRKKFKKLQESQTGLIGEMVRGIRDIKVLNAKQNVLVEVEQRIEETTEKEFQLNNSERVLGLMSNITYDISDFLFILLGSFLCVHNMLTIPSLVILFNYFGNVRNLFKGFNQLMIYFKQFTLSSERIFEVLDNKTYKKEQFGTRCCGKLQGSICFSDVTFAYEKDKNILQNMNFDIKPNETVAFVGKSGAGKTTIFSLIAKLYEKTSGKILLDGIPIEELDENSLRNNMSIITQNPYIFNFSIRENMLLACPDATLEEIREACKMACLDDYIMSLKDGYETKLGEGGLILSGGQRQRLAIARALLQKTEIILFDEATSALDNETQASIQQSIHNMQGEYTILIVAHRLSTVVHSDRILVVDKGKIIADGTHETLLKENDTYRELYLAEDPIK